MKRWMKIGLGITGTLAGIFLGYCAIPNLYARNVSKRVRKTLPKGKNQIALTFDDGPNAQYTGRVLDILKKYQIKATFFIVIKNANQNLDLIERMKAEGHEIALHSYKHQSAWELTPWETLREIPKGEEQLKAQNIKFSYVRPPWGTFNLFTLFGMVRRNLQVILWSIEAYDWRKKQSKEGIADIILDRIEDGSIIVLHDSGGAKGAPEHTIGSLDLWIPELIKRGYHFVTISEGLKEEKGDHQ